MFFGLAALNIIRNFIFKLWIEEKKPCAHFGIHKRSPWSSETKNTPKSWRKFELHLFQSTLNCHSGAPFWAPIFKCLKSTERQLSNEKKMNAVAFLELFFAHLEYGCCKKMDFWSCSSPEHNFLVGIEIYSNLPPNVLRPNGFSKRRRKTVLVFPCVYLPVRSVQQSFFQYLVLVLIITTILLPASWATSKADAPYSGKSIEETIWM